MGILDSLTGSTNGSGGSLYDTLTTDDGTGVDAGALGAFALGLITTAFGTSVAGFIETIIASWVIAPLNGLAEFSRAFTSIIGLPGNGFRIGWSETVEWVTGFGPLAFVVSVIFVVVFAYAVAIGWSLNG